MQIINLSSEPEGKLYSWLPRDVQAEKVVFLLDACPGISPLPTGTVLFTKQEDWRKYALSDCGCGMRLIKSNISPSDLDECLALIEGYVTEEKRFAVIEYMGHL